MVKIIVIGEDGKIIMDSECESALVAATNTDPEDKSKGNMQAFIYGKPRDVMQNMYELEEQVSKQTAKAMLKEMLDKCDAS